MIHYKKDFRIRRPGFEQKKSLSVFCSITIGATMLITAAVSAKEYRGAELYSFDTFKYGKFEFRMRTVYCGGAISSSFLYYNDSWLGTSQGKDEPWREIDLEVFGKSKNSWQSNIITGKLANKVMSENVHATQCNLCDDYHTYAIEWTPDYIAWFFDGALIRKATGQQVTECREKEQSYRFNLWISDVPAWAGAFDPKVLPVYQYISWIKCYEYKKGEGPNGSDFKIKWTDECDSFSANRWGKANWTFETNMVDFTPENIVVKNGILILCLTDAKTLGHSGDVPADKGTSIMKKSIQVNRTESTAKVIPALKITDNAFSSGRIQFPSASYDIIGRVTQKPDCNCKAKGFYLIKSAFQNEARR